MALHADASAKIVSESYTSGSTPSPSPSFTVPQIAAAEAALRAYWAEAAELVPRLLPHMAVYAAALHAPLFAKGTQTTLAVVFERCAQRMERVLEALVEHAGADLSARYPLVFGADEKAAGFGKPLTPLEYVLGYW